MVSKYLQATIEPVACFVLPGLFAGWLFWASRLLSLPWPTWASALLAAFAWYLLAFDAGDCLGRFDASRPQGQTPVSEEGSPEAKLHAALKLLALYLIVAIAMFVGGGMGNSFLRSHPRIGSVPWAPPFRWAAEILSDSQSSPANHLALASATIAVVLGLLVYSFARPVFFPEKKPGFRRGRAVGKVEDAKGQLKKYREPNEPEIVWGGLGLPWSAGVRHFLAAGMTGCGKTNLLLQFMASVLIWIGRKPDQRALVYDPKTELVSFLHGLGLGERLRIMHPFDARGCAWDLAADVDTPSAAQQVASILIPEDKQSKNPYFSRAAGQLLSGVFRFLTTQAPGCWDLRDVIFIMESQARLREVLLRLPETAALVEEFFEPPETFANVRSEIALWMRRYRPIAACWHQASDTRKVSLKHWVTGEYLILLGQDEANRFQLEAINRAMFLRASQLLLNQDNSETRRAWVIIDEVREMGNLEGLSRLLTNGRSKGACFCGGYQTPSGMKDAVGEHVADEINDQIWSIALGRMGGDVSAEWASRMVGDVEFDEQPSDGAGGKSKTPQVVKRRALMPEFFKEIPPPTPQTGVSGVFITPYTGTYCHAVPGAEIAKVRAIRAKDVPDFIARPQGHQELPPWTEEDYRRLRLSPEPQPGGQAGPQSPGEPSRLRVVRPESGGSESR